ncbi:MAG: ferritin family protein [Bacteroidales bacterium]|nr:ferritin family protein [Bacteroidales bacterium]
MNEFKSIDDALDFAIQSEQGAVDFYTNLAAGSKNQAMREVFIQFAKEEMGHKKRLQNIKREETFEFSDEKVFDLQIGDYLIDVEPTNDMTYQEALILAMKREKSAFKLYSDLAGIAPNNDLRKTFLALAQEEAKHKLRFEIEYDDNILKEN